MNDYLGVSGRQSRVSNSLFILLLLHKCCLCIFNSLSCHSGLSLNIILNPYIFLCVTKDVDFSSFLGSKLLFGSQAAQCHQGSHRYCFQTALAFIALMTSSCALLGSLGQFAHGKWRKVLFLSIDQFCVC
jgi:hypothetical protein